MRRWIKINDLNSTFHAGLMYSSNSDDYSLNLGFVVQQINLDTYFDLDNYYNLDTYKDLEHPQTQTQTQEEGEEDE